MMKPKLLVLTPRFPFNTIGGDRIRILHVCRALSAQFSITLLSLCEREEEMHLEPRDNVFSAIHRVLLPRWRSRVNALCALPGSRPLQIAYYDSQEFREAVRRLVPEHDMVVAHLIRTGHYLADIPGLHPPRILEMTDAISMNYQRMRAMPDNRSWKKWMYLFEQKRLEDYERSIVSCFDMVWLASQADRRFLDPQEAAPIRVIPNGTDLDALPFRPAAQGNAIVFIGNMVSLPNQDACHWFIRNVLPLVRRHAAVTFRIVGNAPPAVRRQFDAYENVVLTGRIEHIRDGMVDAFCAVCPLRAAAGIQNKMLEYFALGLPCVTSQLGLGGVEARQGEEVLVFQNASEAAEQILALHGDRAMRMKLAHAARRLVESRYQWAGLYEAFRISAENVRANANRRTDGKDGITAAA